jgi:acetoin utilization protein AcuC
MSNRKLAFIYSPETEAFSYPDDCPFKTQRAGQTRGRLASFGLLGGPGRIELPPRKASRAELERIHTPRYLDELQRAAAGDLTSAGFQMGLGGMDTPVFKDMYDYGAWACGAGLTGVERLLSGEADIVFNLLGGFHHAHAEHAGGFCFLNDVALACHRLAAAGKRVACLDVDAHHGDGTQKFFYRRKDVLTISMHESGRTLYPWGGFENEIGEGPGEGFNVNIPLPAGTYDDAFLRAYLELVPPLLAAYQPDVIVVELGMDILAGDPLTHLMMTNNVVVEVAQHLLDSGKPVLVAGGGGYHLEHTVRGWALAWRTFAGEGDEDVFSLGLGGVMLGSTEWAGGLRDRQLPVTAEQRQRVDAELNATLRAVRQNIFKYHGLETQPADGDRAPVVDTPCPTC